MKDNDKMKKIICNRCNSAYTYTKQDGTIVCRKCGNKFKRGGK